MEELGEFTGFLIIASIAVLSLRYVLKLVFQTFGSKLSEVNKAYLVKAMTIVKQIHPFVSMFALVFLVTHVYLQTGFTLRISSTTLSGMMASLFIVLNVIVGILGQFAFHKPRPKWFKPIHRALTILAIILIIIHIQ